MKTKDEVVKDNLTTQEPEARFLLKRCEVEMQYAGWDEYQSDNFARKELLDDIKTFNNGTHSEGNPVAIVYSMQDGYIGQMVVKGVPHKTLLYTHPAPSIDKVTRLEVIDNNGRSYVNWGVDKMEFSYQDDGRTLKIFTNGSGETK
jgi:hypothetical protein